MSNKKIDNRADIVFGKMMALVMEHKSSPDNEIHHGIADDLLCEALELLGYEDIIELYNSIGKWYS